MFNGSAILSSVLNIVARLEHDRQACKASLEQQLIKTSDLKKDLKREDERRLDLLLESVQAGEFVAPPSHTLTLRSTPSRT